MTTKPHGDVGISQDGTADAPASPSTMHRPNHSPLDMADVAAHDEAQHEAALRDSALRTPR
jgi:hypothetical protein